MTFYGFRYELLNCRQHSIMWSGFTAVWILTGARNPCEGGPEVVLIPRHRDKMADCWSLAFVLFSPAMDVCTRFPFDKSELFTECQLA